MSGRVHGVSVDVRYYEQRQRSKPRGIGRFVEGKFGLDRIIAATAADSQALDAISRARVARLKDARADEQQRIAEASDAE